MEKEKYYIQVEAVNFSNFVFDTNDISTIRGGSFILLDSIKKITEKFKDKIKSISTAASIGLYSFDGSEEEKDKIIKEINEFLEENTSGYATFVIADVVVKEDNQFQKYMEELKSILRKKQWQQLTVRIPEFLETDQECYLDGWRPANEDYNLEKDEKISPMTAYRREKGRDIKHKLFKELLSDIQDENLCAQDLSLLATDKTKGNLNGKIAFIHIDGNNFGKIRRKTCNSEENRTKFDQVIQDEFRIPFLKKLLEKAKTDPAFLTKDSKGKEALRLEILLWGGDEIIIVVPAWNAWKVLDLYYEQAKILKFNNIFLTQRASVIFCHHNAPILHIRNLAENYLYIAKDSILESCETKGFGLNIPHEYGDAFHYLVLKSFDMTTNNLKQFLSNYYSSNTRHENYSHKDFLLTYEKYSKFKEKFILVRNNISREKIRKIILTYHDEDDEKRNQSIEDSIKLVPKDEREKIHKALTELASAFNSASYWYILNDLWDLIPYWEEK